MKFFNLLSFATIIAFSLILTSCDKDDPEIPNEEELITTVNFTLQKKSKKKMTNTNSFLKLLYLD